VTFQEYTMHKITSKTVVLHVLIFMFSDRQSEDKKFLTKCWQAFPIQTSMTQITVYIRQF